MKKAAPTKEIGGPRRLAKKVIDIRPKVGAVIAGLHLVQCEIVVHTAVRGFTRVEGVTLDHCKIRGRHTERVILRQATIDRVTNTEPFLASNVLFDRVTYAGSSPAGSSRMVATL